MFHRTNLGMVHRNTIISTCLEIWSTENVNSTWRLEDWKNVCSKDLSVCLFHVMFGGQCHAVEVENMRQSNYHQNYSDSQKHQKQAGNHLAQLLQLQMLKIPDLIRPICCFQEILEEKGIEDPYDGKSLW